MKSTKKSTKKADTKKKTKDVPCADINRNRRGQIEYTKYVLFDGTNDEYNGKHRAYFVCTYLPIETIDPVIFKGAKTYAWIKHDKDDKKEHNHFIVCFNNAVSCKGLLKKLDIDTLQSYVTVCHDAKLCFDYMLHRDTKSVELGKHRYDVEEVLTEDINYFDRYKGNDVVAKRAKSDKANEDFLNDMLDDKMTYRQKAIKYGRDYMKNYRAYESFAYVVRHEESYVLCEAEHELERRRSRISYLVKRAKEVCDTYGLEFTNTMRETVSLRAVQEVMDIELLADFIGIDIETGVLR